MKRILFFVLVFLAIGNSAFAYPGNFKPGSEPDGFRGIKWGTELSTLSGMEYLRTDPSYGGIPFYTKEKDDLTIGGAKLETVEYGFWQGKLYIVIINTKGSVNWSGLEDATFEKFGEGFQSNKYIENFFWSGKITTITLKYNEISKTGYLWMGSAEITKQVRDFDKKRAAEGAEKGF